MSVYKEAMFIVRKLKAASTRIYNDACDYGVPVRSFADESIQMVKQLEEMYFSAEYGDYKKVEGHGIGATQTIKITMCDEFGDRKEFPLVIQYVKVSDTPHKHPSSLVGEIIGYLTIDDQDKW